MNNPDHALLLRAASGELALPVAVHTSPLARDLGTRLLATDASAGTLRLSFTPGEAHLQGNGAVQGGIVAAMLDFAAAFVVLMRVQPPRTAVTAALDVKYLRSTRAGTLIAEARLTRLGATLAFAEASLSAAGQAEVSATASAVLPLVGSPRTPDDAPPR